MLKNSSHQYGTVAIVLHWLMAVAIVFLFALGLYMVELTYYDAWYKGSLDLHKSIGISVFLLLLARVAWRFFNVVPEPIHSEQPSAKVLASVAHYVHLLLYALMFLIVLTGFLISTADGRAIDVFGVLSIPALPFSIEQQEDVAGEIHFWLAWSLMTLIAVHALGAFKHHFFDKDRTLLRMVNIKQNKSE